MNAPTTSEFKPDRSAKMDARCPKNIREKFERIASLRGVELSDVVRESWQQYAAKFEQQLAAFN